MSTNLKIFNYFLKEEATFTARPITCQIANFFMKKFNKPVLVFTTHYLTGRDSELYFNDLTTNQKELITSLYCKTFDVLLEKLLDLDENPFTKNRMFPKCIIIESMHKWTDSCTYKQTPQFYLKIIAALQDVVNVFSRLMDEPCYSFVSSCIDEVPIGIIYPFYCEIIEESEANVQEILNGIDECER